MIVAAERRWTRDRERRPLWLAQEGRAGGCAAHGQSLALAPNLQGSVGYLPFKTPFHSPLALTGFLAPPHPHLHPQSPRAMRLTPPSVRRLRSRDTGTRASRSQP